MNDLTFEQLKETVEIITKKFDFNNYLFDNNVLGYVVLENGTKEVVVLNKTQQTYYKFPFATEIEYITEGNKSFERIAKLSHYDTLLHFKSETDLRSFERMLKIFKADALIKGQIEL